MPSGAPRSTTLRPKPMIAGHIIVAPPGGLSSHGVMVTEVGPTETSRSEMELQPSNRV